MTTSKIISSDLQEQREYAAMFEKKGSDFSLMVADAFVRGIRDIGYKSTATALYELIDNAIQGEANNVHVVFGFGRDMNKPASIAIIDDGHGIPKSMLRLAVMWGGTHREKDRSGFGRYGYGLPSSSVSQGKRFTVYSQVEGEGLYSITLDLGDIADGKYTNDQGRIEVPKPQPATLPGWVATYIKNTIKQPFLQGTIVILEKLDRLTWTTTSNLEVNLLKHFGVTYRNYLRQVNMWVNEKPVEPVDPLFTTPGFRYYDIDEDRAEPLEPRLFEVKDHASKESMGVVKVRYSYMPPTFLREPEDKNKTKGGKNNARFKIRSENTGLIILRNGRQIDVVGRGGGWLNVNNDDRYWGVEIDFPATLDEEFSITTSKQQVVLSDRMWEILSKEGVQDAIKELRRRYDQDTAKLKAANEAEKARRASEQAMEAAEKFRTRKPAANPVDREREAQENLDREARRIAQEIEQPVDLVKRDLESQAEGRPYKVRQEASPGAPFYRVVQLGGQTVLFLNTAHRFYTNVYAGPESTPRLRAAIEVMLFVLGGCELEASKDRRLFYETERAVWSNELAVVLDRLDQIDSIDTAESAVERGDNYVAEMAQAA